MTVTPDLRTSDGARILAREVDFEFDTSNAGYPAWRGRGVGFFH
jgi:hypothetical protein